MINVFRAYKNCFTSGRCPLNPEDFDRMAKALFSNQSMKVYYGKNLRIINAKYFAEYSNNIDIAIANVLEAIILEPTLEEFMLLAQYYEEGGYYKEMKRTIDFMDEHDKYGQLRKFIRQANKRYFHHLIESECAKK